MLPTCSRCGEADPVRMYGLMALWFARYADLALDGGYFYLCPACHARCIEPHDDVILERLAEHLGQPRPPLMP